MVGGGLLGVDGQAKQVYQAGTNQEQFSGKAGGGERACFELLLAGAITKSAHPS